jgi:hypothetical protein
MWITTLRMNPGNRAKPSDRPPWVSANVIEDEMYSYVGK